MDFAVPTDHRVKSLKNPKKTGKYLDLAKELKKLLNVTVTVILIIIGALRTVAIQTTALLRYKKEDVCVCMCV